MADQGYIDSEGIFHRQFTFSPQAREAAIKKREEEAKHTLTKGFALEEGHKLLGRATPKGGPTMTGNQLHKSLLKLRTGSEVTLHKGDGSTEKATYNGLSPHINDMGKGIHHLTGHGGRQIVVDSRHGLGWENHDSQVADNGKTHEGVTGISTHASNAY